MLETLAKLLGVRQDSAEFALFLSTLPLLGEDWEQQIDTALAARTPALVMLEILRLTRRCVALVDHAETLATGRAGAALRRLLPGVGQYDTAEHFRRMAPEHRAGKASAALACDRRQGAADTREAWLGEPHPSMVKFAPKAGVRFGTDSCAVAQMSAVSRRATVDGPKQALEAGHQAVQAVAAHCIITVQACGGRGITPTFEVKVTALRKTRRGGKKHRK